MLQVVDGSAGFSGKRPTANQLTDGELGSEILRHGECSERLNERGGRWLESFAIRYEAVGRGSRAR